MIERHWNTEPVIGGQLDRAGDEIGVVDDVVVGQRRALRRAGGARGELDIDGIAGLQRRRNPVETFMLVPAAHRQHVAEIEHAGRCIVAHADDDAEARQPRRLEPAGLAHRELRRQRLDHLEVVRRFEAHRADQRAAADLPERIFELDQAIGGIDVDQHQADAGGRELRHQPFPAVRRPDADAVALLEPEAEQAGGKRIDRLGQLVPGEALVLLDEHRCVARAVGLGGRGKQRRNGFVQQRLGRSPETCERPSSGAMNVAPCLSPCPRWCFMSFSACWLVAIALTPVIAAAAYQGAARAGIAAKVAVAKVLPRPSSRPTPGSPPLPRPRAASSTRRDRPASAISRHRPAP